MTTRHGIQFTLPGFLGQQRPSMKSAGRYGSRTVALWKSPNASRTRTLTGHLKRSLNTPTNGSQRNEDLQMETHTAQGFLRLLLTEQEAATIIHSAKKAGRYLIPLEVSKILKKDITKTLTAVEEQRMNDTWLAFCKGTDSDQRTGCTDPEVLERWFAYVAKNYQEPLPEASPWDTN